MPQHALVRPGGIRAHTRADLTTLVYRINERRKEFFARLLTALDESRRREAAKILRQYQHLTDNDIE